MAKKKTTAKSKPKTKAKKKSAPKVPKENADSVFRSHARKLGIPEDGSDFSDDELRVVWIGTGDKCSEVVSSVEKKCVDSGFEKSEIPKSDEHVDDPIVETLQKMELIPIRRRELMFKKSSPEWTATVMVEHNVQDSSTEDGACIVFFIEQNEAKE